MWYFNDKKHVPADTMNGLSEAGWKTELDILYEDLLEQLARLSLLHCRCILKTANLGPDEGTLFWRKNN